MLKRFGDVVVDPSTVILVSRGHGDLTKDGSTMAVRTEDNSQMVISISRDSALKLINFLAGKPEDVSVIVPKYAVLQTYEICVQARHPHDLMEYRIKVEAKSIVEAIEKMNQGMPCPHVNRIKSVAQLTDNWPE